MEVSSSQGRTYRIGEMVTLVGVMVAAFAHYWGLVWAPPEKYMGDVGRIIYAHVPMALMGLFAATVSFVCSVGYMFSKRWGFDATAAASAEVSAVFGAATLLTGAIWGKPTWGDYWAWDPRLTTMLILFFSYVGYLTLRAYVDDPEKRAVWSGVTGILIAINVPLVYYSVRIWNTLHQPNSSTQTVDPEIYIPLRVAITGGFLVCCGWIIWRARLNRRAIEAELNFDDLSLDSSSGSQGVS